MLLRGRTLVLAMIFVSSSLGCVTWGAVEGLTSESELLQLHVSHDARRSRIDWKAEFSTPSTMIFICEGTGTTKGRWDVPTGARICVADGDEQKPLGTRMMSLSVDGYGPRAGVGESRPDCTHQLARDQGVSGEDGTPFALVELATGDGRTLYVPREVPARNPSRWLRLITAPLGDGLIGWLCPAVNH